MSWIRMNAEHLRLEFVLLASEPQVSLSEACRQFQISRKTGYKWRQRYRSEGLTGLMPRRRRPLRSPLQVGGDVVATLVRLRNDHETWGPKKLRVLLGREGFCSQPLPSLVTIGRILKRAGLTVAKRRGRPRHASVSGPLTVADGPNKVWTVDFKGWWRTGDGKRCEPLGIRDLYSRYILCLQPVKQVRTEALQQLFRQVFERYGLPEVIRSDNGAPFVAPTAPHGLTRLSAWWRTLGIGHDRIAPGHPQQNGSHERMHRDLAAEIARTPAESIAEETRRLETWRREYNLHRPHEALAMKTPAEVYRCSGRQLHQVRPYNYPVTFRRVRVRNNGSIRLEGHKEIRVSAALAGLDVGLERVSDTGWRIWFCNLEVRSFIPEPNRQPAPVLALLPESSRACHPCPDNKVLPMCCS